MQESPPETADAKRREFRNFLGSLDPASNPLRPEIDTKAPPKPFDLPIFNTTF
jgi:hypothetical protein